MTPPRILTAEDCAELREAADISGATCVALLDTIDALRAVNLSAADALDAALNERDALRARLAAAETLAQAADKITNEGSHASDCDFIRAWERDSSKLPDPTLCDCGYVELDAALAEWRKAKGE
jgi:hypothetical protein